MEEQKSLTNQAKTFEAELMEYYKASHGERITLFSRIKKLDEIYNQPFSLGMMQRYFGLKGTDVKHGLEYAYTKFRVGALCNIEIDLSNKLFMKISSFNFPYPKTLNEFIICCSLAGIKLEWKGVDVNEH